MNIQGLVVEVGKTYTVNFGNLNVGVTKLCMASNNVIADVSIIKDQQIIDDVHLSLPINKLKPASVDLTKEAKLVMKKAYTEAKNEVFKK